MGEAEINAFLTHLAVSGQVSASTQTQRPLLTPSDWRSLLQSLTGINPLRCEVCGQNTLHLIEDLAPPQSPRASPR